MYFVRLYPIRAKIRLATGELITALREGKEIILERSKKRERTERGEG